LKAVLFDLDDTLFDHQYSRRKGLEFLRTLYTQLAAVSIPELEIEHEKILLSFYYQTLDGSIGMEEARLIRIQRLGERYGIMLQPEEIGRLARDYNSIYEKERRAVPGSAELLRSLREKGLKIGVITNGLLDAQQEKLRICGLDQCIDFMLVSETFGVRKPDPQIFLEGMRLAGAGPEEVIFIGDAWDPDIVGASRCGLKTIWLNRYGFPCPDPQVAVEINSFLPLKKVIRLLLIEL
jgi:putative hydrolase of the HAD superfamily